MIDKKKVMVASTLMGVVGASTACASVSNYMRGKEVSYAEMNEEMQAIAKSIGDTEETTIEYGDDSIDLETSVKEEQAKHPAFEISYSVDDDSEFVTFSTDDVGKHWVVYSFSASDKYGQKASDTKKVVYTVEDTQAPVIELTTEEVTVYTDQEYDVSKLVKSVTDAVDGELEYVENVENTSESSETIQNGEFNQTDETDSTNTENSLNTAKNGSRNDLDESESKLETMHAGSEETSANEKQSSTDSEEIEEVSHAQPIQPTANCENDSTAQSKAKSTGTYTIETEYENGVPAGEYAVKVIATDRNGLATETSATIKVVARPSEKTTRTSTASSESSYEYTATNYDPSRIYIGNYTAVLYFGAENQGATDGTDSAIYYNQNGLTVVADHASQGFGAMLNYSNGVFLGQKIHKVSTHYGTVSEDEKDIYYDGGGSFLSNYDAPIVMYTCIGNGWTRRAVTYWDYD